MKEEIIQKIHNCIISGTFISPAISKRSKDSIFESVPHELVSKYQNEGWSVQKEYKTATRMKRLKPLDMAFEDEVWTMLAKMGFTFLTKTVTFGCLIRITRT